MSPERDYYFPSRRLISQDDAAVIENARVQRSRFTNEWSRKTTFNAADLIPILVEEVLPGDHLTYEVTAYVRMATPLFPMFDNQRIDTFFFFVPNRLVWANWIRLMGQQDNPSSSIDYSIPITASPAGGFPQNGLYDHFGLPCTGQITAGQVVEVSVLPARAYNLIWNSWFRDQNIINGASFTTGDGPDTYSNYLIQKRAKSHDYFTTALPWPQKFTAPSVPVAGLAPVLGIGTVAGTATDAAVTVFESDLTTTAYAQAIRSGAGGGADIMMEVTGAGPGAFPKIFADLASATGVAINTLRQSWMIQSLLERDARGGTRYTELIRSHFGVINPDFRLQRPEYIGGGSTPLNITPIAQTAPTTGVPLGALGAAGAAAGQHRASYAATEHGYIIGLINVRSELSYQQGIPRHFRKRTRYDFYWPSLAGLGEQAILRQEIYATGVDADDETIFGYQERWHEYRTRYSEVTGIFRSTHTGTLDAWHLAQRFTAAPILNAAFIQDDPPMSRVLAAGAAADKQQYLADILFRRTAVRPIPMFGTPSTLGRF